MFSKILDPDRIAFIEAIRAAPKDAAIPSIFADWLDEHDEPEQAEWIRLNLIVEQAEVYTIQRRVDAAKRMRSLMDDHAEKLWPEVHAAAASCLLSDVNKAELSLGPTIGPGQTTILVSKETTLQKATNPDEMVTITLAYLYTRWGLPVAIYTNVTASYTCLLPFIAKAYPVATWQTGYAPTAWREHPEHYLFGLHWHQYDARLHYPSNYDVSTYRVSQCACLPYELFKIVCARAGVTQGYMEVADLNICATNLNNRWLSPKIVAEAKAVINDAALEYARAVAEATYRLTR